MFAQAGIWQEMICKCRNYYCAGVKGGEGCQERSTSLSTMATGKKDARQKVMHHSHLHILKGWKAHERELLMFFHLYTCALLVLNSWCKSLPFHNVYTERYSHHFKKIVIKSSCVNAQGVTGQVKYRCTLSGTVNAFNADTASCEIYFTTSIVFSWHHF